MAAKPKRKKARRRSAGEVSVAPPHGESETLRIRQISNGYVISRSGMKRGKYVEHEEYSQTKPIITAGVPKRSPATGRSK